MGEIDTQVDKQKDLTTHVVTGDITAQELLDKINAYFTGDEVTRLLLWDLSGASLENIKSEEVTHIARMTYKYAGQRKGGKTALLVSSDLGYGLGRIYTTQHSIQGTPLNYMIFRDRNQAMDWLGVTAGDLETSA